MKIERQFPNNVYWIEAGDRMEVTTELIAKVIGVPEKDVFDYLRRLETETTYKMEKHWVVNGRMTRLEPVMTDREIILLQLAMGKAEVKRLGTERLVFEVDLGEEKRVTTIAMTEEQYQQALEAISKIELIAGDSGQS